MQLRDYHWFGNPRAMHNEGAFKPIQRERLQALRLGWYKLVCGGAEFIADCQWMLSVGIMPVIRIYREVPGAMPVDDVLRGYWQSYCSIGVKWFEFYNEPNFAIPEWRPEMHAKVHWRNTEEIIKPLSENWLIFAETIINMGCYPAFPAMGEANGEGNSSILWVDAMLNYLREHHLDRFINVARNGMWCATHPYTLNHFYQQVPGQPATPRPQAQYNALEPGWHFEYPYDPLSQALDPGRTVFGGTALTPYGDPNGLTAMGVAFTQRLRDWFGLDPVPVFGTEGGIYPLSINETQQPDPRFPAYDRAAHAEATAAMFNWIATSAPEWFFGVALWKEDEYYNNNLPAVARLQQVQQLPYGSGTAGWYALSGRGPGPIHGDPTFHAVILAPGLETNWFFATAQAYWNQFRPIVTTTWDFIDHMTNEQSLAVTVISPPERVETMRNAIQQKYPNVLFDLIVAEGDLSAVTDTLQARVWANRRFG